MSRQLNARIFYFKAGTPEQAEKREDPMFRYLVDAKVPTQEEFERDYAQVGAVAVPDPIHPEDHLEAIFVEFNNGQLSSPASQAMLKKLGVGHTSMSVGDVVIFGYNALGPGPFEQTTAYIVANVGFVKVELHEPSKT